MRESNVRYCWRGAAREVVLLWRSRKPAYECGPDAERHKELLLPQSGGHANEILAIARVLRRPAENQSGNDYLRGQRQHHH